ncbi:Non-classical arabinogalactan protein [Actinidia chinensis var. chinensis]|uniref:Non-classical arabinogalactan protein n=1 Tax=Actinidia chinensis var. chinensis TaxID=1590841 RepID=A0A2R6PXH0_ACTCC|nr:Non-classical arabinogalactan protein [Actinidia chinensis var. chinensis]
MVSHFLGCNNLVRLMFLMFMSFLLFLATHTMAGRQINPLVEFSSREELAEMAGYGEEKLSTVLVSGTVLCEACSDENGQTNPQTMSGALVAVSCQTNQKTSKSNWVESTTDEYGDFLIDLPSHLHAIPNLDKRCLVKILQLPKNSPCHPAFTGKQAGLKLSSAANGIRTYTAENLYLTRKTSPECMFAGNGEGKSALVKAY